MRRKKNKEFNNITIERVGSKGKSIGTADDGKTIIIDGGAPGDLVNILTTKQRKSYYQGKITEFHKYSDIRTNPKCEHFGICGGCKWQHIKYEEQLKFKEVEVKNNLLRIGNLTLPKITPIKGAANNYFYRNKMEYSFSDSRWLSLEEIKSKKIIKEKNALGFHIPGMWNKVVDINKCWLQVDITNTLRNSIKDFSIKNNIPFFNHSSQTGDLRTLMIRTTSTNEVMVLVQFYSDNKKNRELLLDFLIEEFPKINSLLYVVNNKANDTIYDQEVKTYYGNSFITEKMEGLEFKINAKSFYQTNSDQAYELYKIVREISDLKSTDIVYDLYTGTGTIALFISKNVKKVVGIEAVPDAIAAAKENAINNKILNTDFHVGDMKSVFNNDFIKLNGNPDVIITDPPRDGMHKKVIQQIKNISPKKIVYVSCNSATQARDLELLKDEYNIINLQAVDMFPQTHHVENVVLLKKK
ncbi:23S rRNA (uracil(1939)-C(5))-methyltransferase RlmD [Flavobacteriaceae bacterium]|jgi:23S rRNA (uracil1939-C5)-methyltransferase|nr:23S rRNA (uracil(1939)-C(5))-methyltransferase RlmD [Flavobacteriaceae bacterium]MDC0552283.1 23S rRNA (uracil(1939)-C(5))-methyltransferase RlmD [Flavobacteriaceae bacterium]